MPNASARLRFLLSALLASTPALAAAPLATTTPATGITNTSAVLNGAGNPSGEPTIGWFRYDTVDPGTCDDTFGTRVPATSGTDLGTGAAAVPYSITTTGLVSGTTYYFCAIVGNASGTAFGAVLSFVVPGAPITLTVAATNVTATSARLNGSANPVAASTTGYFRYSATTPGTCDDTFGTRAPSSGGSSLGFGTASVDYYQNISGLLPGNTYYFCAIASNLYGTSFGTVLTFTTPALPPSTYTNSATGVTATAATLNGSANPNGDNTTGWFRYATASPGTCNDTFGSRLPSSGGTSLGSGNGSVPFSEPATGLLPGTTYYFCAIAQNSLGTTYGSVYTLTTPAVPPTVTTLAATSVTAFSATLNGSANPGGGSTTGWFRYDTSDPGTCNDTFGTRAPTSGGSGLGSGNSVVSFSRGISGLTPTTTYYFCAIAQSSAGTSLGEVLSFTTPAGAPAVTTTAATSLGGTSATVNGTANPNGDATTGWFRYDTTSPGTCNDTFGTRAPASGGTDVGSGLSAVAYSEALSGLVMGTTYYYCAVAQNAVGLSFGTVRSFVTYAPPTVTTSAVSTLGNTTATLPGVVNPNRDTTTGWFRYSTTNPGTCDDAFGTRAPATGGITLGSGSSNVPMYQAVSGLTPKTTYYYCAIAQNPEGTSLGAVLQFTTYDQPAVTTLAATGITSTSATLNSMVNPNGNATYMRFRYASTDPGTCDDTFGTATSSVYEGSGTTPLWPSATVSVLPGVTYYFCAIAWNGYGTSYGAVLSFTAPAAPPQVSTLSATSVTNNAATLRGQGRPNGAATTGWFRYDTTDPGACNDTFGTRAPATGGSDLGSGNSWVSFSEAIASLTPATTYYFCAIAESSAGTAFGSILSFTTPTPPAVTTTAATGVTNNGVTLNGSGNPNLAATTGWFRISATDPGTCDDTFGTRVPASGGSNLGAGSSPVPFSQSMTGLSPGTTYYYCAIDSNIYGTALGAILSFTTAAAPSVTTLAATSVTYNSALLNGSVIPNGGSSTGWFRISATDPGTCNDSFGTRVPSSGGASLGSGSTAVAYSYTSTGRSPVTTYYYCAIASSSYGLSFGEVLSFTTPAGAPIVSTLAAAVVDATSATLNGSANPMGDATTAWFRYSTVDPGSCSDLFGTRVPATGGVDLGAGITGVSYAQALTGLTTGATYYFCAIASSSVGTSFGILRTFIPADAPLVTTDAATSVTNSWATLNSSINPNGNSTYAYFRYATTDPGTCSTSFGTATTSNWMGSGAAALSNASSISGLSPATTYYYCAIAYNSYGTTLGAILSFTTAPNPPSASTSGVSSLTLTSAVLDGQGIAGGAATTGWFRYSTTSPGTCNDTFGTRAPGTGGSDLGSGTTWVSYSQAISGLSPATLYYYCAITQNSAGTAFGSVRNFTTPTAPEATTVAATNITGTSARLNGTGDPNYAAANGWFRMSTADPGTCDDAFGTATPPASLGLGGAPQSYSYTFSSLSPGTTYYYCAIVSNAYGTAFGAVLSFTTASAPSVTTTAATGVTSSAATMNASVVPNGMSTTGWFRYSTTSPGTCNDTFGTRAPTSGGTALGSGSSAVPLSYSLTGLLPGNTYYYCAIAQNGVGTIYGAVLSFTTLALIPTVSTNSPSGVTNTAATLNGSANPRGAATTAYFRYSTVSPGGCNDTFGTRAPASGGSLLGAGNSAVSFSQSLTGLAPATTYYYCAIATNSEGTGFGAVSSFTTLAAPVVLTLAATPVTATSATLNASATPNGSATTSWFRYANADPGGCDDTFGTRVPTSGGTGLGSGWTGVNYSQSLSGLAPATTYWFCAIASNSIGTSFGAVLSFTTPPAAPSVTTLAASAVMGTTATLNASALPNGDDTTGWFRYSTTSPGTCNDTFGTRGPATGGAALGAGTAAVPYSQAITGLATGTRYYVCAIASNGVGLSVGTVVSFVTAAPPSVTTSAAAGVTSTAATLNGSANPNGAATTGYFRYDTADPGTCDDTFGTRAPATGGSILGSGSTAVPYSQALVGLTPGTTYYFCAIASSSVDTRFGAVSSFTTLAAPTIVTLAATPVTATTATLNASANPNGSATTGWLRYANADPGSCDDTFGTRVPASGGAGLGSGWTSAGYSQSIGGLAPATTYWFCAIASNSIGTSFGAVLSFTTPPVAPEVTTLAASGTTGTTATLNASANPNGDATTGWFRYGTTSPGTCNDTFGTRAPATGGVALGGGTAAAPYSQAITGLAAGTTYYACAIASNSIGLSAGTVVSFITAAPPSVTTSAATGVASTTATLNGSANPNQAATTGWFRYDTVNPGSCDDTFGTRAPASGGTSLGSGGTTISYSEALSGLTPGATYYFCAIASSPEATSFGAVLSFTTLAAPTVATLSASSVSNNAATLNGSANPNLLATTGWFRYSPTDPGTCDDTFGTRAPASGGSSLGSGSTTASYSQAISGLTPGTTYYFCAIASNSVGTSFGAVLSFTTQAAPTVATLLASSVSSNAATLNGSANPNLLATTGWFRYSPTDPGACDDTFGTRAPASGGSSLGSGGAAAPYSEALSGLAPATTYYVCAIASNSLGTSFGTVVSFTTTAAPVATTAAATAVASTTATLNGSANPMLDATAGWFRFDTVDPGTCDDTFGTRAPASGGSSLGSGGAAVAYSEALSGLAPATTYYFCAIASNSVGTSFGAVLSFTTLAAPTVATLAASSVSNGAATLNGSANPMLDATTGWFRFDTVDPGTCDDTFGTRAPASGGSSLGSGSTTISYSEALSGLAPATTYYFCAIASNSVGMSFGAVLSFTTTALPAVTTSGATGVASTTATLNGAANPMLDATTGWFRYDTVDPGACNDAFGTRAPASGGAILGSGGTPLSYSQAISGLTPATTYYFCAIASNSVGTSFGALLSFTTTALPAVTTSAATGVASGTATLNGSANPMLDATTGWFRYSTASPGTCDDTFGTRAPSTGGSSLGSGNSAVAYSQTLSGLAPATTYYFCAIASNSVGTSFGSVTSFTTLAAPAVTTSAATGVTSAAATLNGAANPMLDATTGWFRYDTVNPGACNDTFGTRTPASGGASLGSGSTAVTYSQAISGLANGTTYFFCAIASNSVGTSFGAVMTFTTMAAPVATTSAATSVASTGATLNGSANPMLDATTGWFRYDTVSPGTCNDAFGIRAPASGGASLGSGGTAVSYSQAISGLTPATTYYFCAIASSSVGISFGAVLSFTTTALPAVTTSGATGVASATATLNGSANPNLAATTGWFRYGTTDPGTCNDTFGTRAPASGGATLGSGTSAVSYSQAISGLAPSATYYFCAIASSSVGTSFGAVMSFTTLAAPAVTTSAATTVTSATATLNGSANPNLAAATGWFRYSTASPGTCNDTFGIRAPTTGGASLGSGSTAVPYSQALSGLASGTTYYFCAIASNSVGTSFGALLTFTTTAAPAATTSAATSVASTTATLNGAANPMLDATTGWFRYDAVTPGTCNDTFGTRAPASGGAILGAGGTAVSYSQPVSGLAPATTYYFCAIASNSIGISFGAVMSFTTAAAPVATTSAATSVGSATATLNGAANPMLDATTGWFRYGTVNPGTCNDTFGTRAPATGGASLGAGSAAIPYSQAVSGLSPATTYYFCAIASNSVGTSFGAVLSFTTTAAPAVTTSAATAVASATATLNGSATPMLAATTGWFRYSTTSPGTCNDTFGIRAPASGGSSLGAGSTAAAYSQAISGLVAGTTYYFCAIASNSVGTSFGAVLSFVTTATPAVTTSAATAVASTTATLNGAANPMLDATTGWFRYSTSSPGTCNDTFGTRAPATGGVSLGSGSAAIPYSQALSGLTPGATYYFCAIASNSVGTSFGSILTFTTLASPVVSSSAATGVASAAATLNGSANPMLGATTGWFRFDTIDPGTCNDAFGTRAPASGGSSLGSGSTAVPYSQTLSGLTPSTTYYFCAIASNATGISFGTVLSFTTTAVPAVTTSAATAIASTTATLNGSANPMLAATTGWFRYGTSSPGTCNDSFGIRAPATGGSSLGSGSTAVPYSQAVSGLASGTTYYYCAIASNSVGLSFGAVLSFTTAAAPAVTTSAATAVASTTATLNGAANPMLAATTGWFRYDTVSPGTCNDSFGIRAPATGGSSLGAGSTAVSYSQAVSGLASGTTYYFCAIASSSIGTSFGAILSFTTLSPPAVTTEAAVAVAGTSATLNGSANPGLDATTGWFRYSAVNPGACNDAFGTRAPGSGGADLGSGNTATPYSQALAGLTPGTTYYFCAIASNSVGTSFGAILSFTTLSAPAVTTQAAVALTGTSATLNGSANPGLDATTGWFRYSSTDPGACDDTFGTRAPSTGGEALGAGSSAVAYSRALSGLIPGTTYYFCAIASNSVATSFGAVLSFRTPAEPQVTTSPATSLTATTATLSGAANPNQDATTGWFRYDVVDPGACSDAFGTRLPASGGAALGSGTSSIPYSQILLGLAPGATYYYCAIASNSHGTAYGTVLSFTTPVLPTATSSTATGVTATGATLNGSASPNGNATAAWFRYSAGDPGSCNDSFGTRAPASSGTDLGSGSASVPFSEALTGLAPGTTYYFCAIASSSAGTAYGAVLTFLTVGPPVVVTSPPTDVTIASATLNGSANPTLDATTGWFRYDTVDPGSCDDTFGTRSPATGGYDLGAGSSPVSFSEAIAGLAPATTYYVCAIASNALGTAFGAVATFTTGVGAPTVETKPATDIVSTGATLVGSANPNGYTASGWFRYGASDPGTCDDSFGTRVPATGELPLGAGTAPASYSVALTGLSPLTTYYFCAAAVNAGGAAFGNVLSFTTSAPAPQVETLPAEVTKNTAVLSGSANPNGAATTGWFRYGDFLPAACDDSFGTRVPTADGTALGSGTQGVTFSQTLAELKPGTYHYCAVASSASGTSYGEVMSFEVAGGCGCGASGAGSAAAWMAGLLWALAAVRHRRCRKLRPTSGPRPT